MGALIFILIWAAMWFWLVWAVLTRVCGVSTPISIAAATLTVHKGVPGVILPAIWFVYGI